MSFPNINCPKRTDQSFRNREQQEHHKERSIIEDITGVDMIGDFPISDPLHLLHLGIMKKCLIRWVDGTKSYKSKLRTPELNRINATLGKLKFELPTEIHRTVRDLNTLHFWKGTEYRTFLLYLGIIALKDIVHIDEYNHFVQLSCAVILLSSKVYECVVHNTVLIDSLLEAYIEKYIELYGEQSISSNVHNLVHVKDDVIRLGDLNSISTYPFENALRMMKLKLRGMSKPLEQLSRRMAEIFQVMDFKAQPSNQTTQLKNPFHHDKSKFQAVFLGEFRLSSQKFGDKWFMTHQKHIIEFKYATVLNGVIMLHGYEVKVKRDFFTYPLHSSKLNIYSTTNSQSGENDEILAFKIEDIKCKMICTSCNTEFIFQPLLHTLK